MGITDVNNIAYVRQTMIKTEAENVIKLKYELYENGASQSGFNNCEYCMYAE